MSFVPQELKDFYAEVAIGNFPEWEIVSKFGANPSVPNGSFEIISTLSTAYTGFIATPETVRIAAGGNVADDAAGTGAREVTIAGLDSVGNRASEAVSTNGVSASSSTTTIFRRVDRAYVSESGDYAAPWNVGDIVIETTTSGDDLVDILALNGQTLHAHYAVPDSITEAYLIGYELTADSNKPSDFRLVTRERIEDTVAPVAAQRIKRSWPAVLGSIPHTFIAPILLGTGQMDVWMEASGNGATTVTSGSFQILLRK